MNIKHTGERHAEEPSNQSRLRKYCTPLDALLLLAPFSILHINISFVQSRTANNDSYSKLQMRCCCKKSPIINIISPCTSIAFASLQSVRNEYLQQPVYSSSSMVDFSDLHMSFVVSRVQVNATAKNGMWRKEEEEWHWLLLCTDFEYDWFVCIYGHNYFLWNVWVSPPRRIYSSNTN